MSETNNLNQTWQTGQTQTGWLFTSVVENLNPNWPPWKKNPASGQDGTPACKFQLSNRSITQPPQQGGTRNITVRGYTPRELIGSKKAPNVWNPGVFILYKNHPGEILWINIKLENLTWWENDPPQSISKTAEQTLQLKNYIASNHSPNFLNLLERNGANHLIVPEFPVLTCK